MREFRPARISLFSFADLPEQLPLQRRIKATDLPSQWQRLAMLVEAHRLLTGDGWEAIGMDHDALAGDSLAVAAREGRPQQIEQPALIRAVMCPFKVEVDLRRFQQKLI